ncbi:MAG: ECF transporter S component [Candidatus Odinarchaeum yellowstonii]|jgi:uncharacterized membrane protein|uniref:ECF transporter S component n=1 Tax=Odinarchaeota yellowstonii (strain LCB_4) TaxID=1841599 RepID=A0AAF0D123_ODILC|nr:MAG: ECF transporter S component [Candidatus Odinarchaeum yellowstonii]
MEEKNSTYKIVLIALTASLYVVISILPGIPVAPGVEIQFEAGFAVVIGFLLGPYLGFITALLGSSIAWFILGSGVFSLPFIFNPAVNALFTGIIFHKKYKTALISVTIVYITLIILQLTSPPLWPPNVYWLETVAVLYDKILGLVLFYPACHALQKIKPIQSTNQVKYSFLIILLIALVGNILDNLLGTVVFSYPLIYNGIFGMSVETVRFYFLLYPYLYILIRLAQAVFAALIIIALSKTGVIQKTLSNN